MAKSDKATLEIKYETIRVLPPIGKQARIRNWN